MSFVLFFSKHKETLVVLKIMLPDNKRTFWYTYKAHLILLSTLTSEFGLFGNRTVLYITLPNAEPRMGVCRHEAPQPSCLQRGMAPDTLLCQLQCAMQILSFPRYAKA